MSRVIRKRQVAVDKIALVRIDAVLRQARHIGVPLLGALLRCRSRKAYGN